MGTQFLTRSFSRAHAPRQDADSTADDTPPATMSLPLYLSLDATDVTVEEKLLDGICTVKCLGAKSQAEVCA